MNKTTSDFNFSPTLSPGGIRYSLEGDGPLIVALGGISADSQVIRREDGSPGWWSWLIGPSRTIDTQRFRVLSFDYLAADLSSPHDPGFVSTHLQAEVLKNLLDHLGVEKISTFIGASYGGMVGLAFAAQYPERVENLVVVSAAHRNSPFSVGLRTIQRKIVQLSSSSNRKEYLSLARALAMLTYRTAEEIDTRFNEKIESPDPESSAIWSYLEYNGDKYASATDALRFLSLSRSIDHHEVEPAQIQIPLTVVTCNQDLLVPPQICEELVNAVKGPSRLIRFDSIYGHDAFLKEQETQIQKIMTQIMEVQS